LSGIGDQIVQADGPKSQFEIEPIHPSWGNRTLRTSANSGELISPDVAANLKKTILLRALVFATPVLKKSQETEKHFFSPQAACCLD